MTQTLIQRKWPFWAATPDEAIERALEMAGVGPGCRLVDLGCGDGRVLEAAVRRGATATGYEVDPVYLEKARKRLAHVECANVIETDFNTAAIDADVVFAFLSPASLYGLRNRLAALAPGTRILTYAYGVAGWRPAAMDQGCFLYTLPAEAAQDTRLSGWRHAGLVMAQPCAKTVLVGAMYGAMPGKLAVEVSPSLESRIQVHLGAAECSGPENVPIDIRFNSAPGEEVLTGTLSLQGRDLFVCLVSGGENRLSRRVRSDDVEAIAALCREAEAGGQPVSQLIDSLSLAPAGLAPARP